MQHETNEQVACYQTRKLLNPEDPDDVWYYFEKKGYGWINPLHDIPLYVDKQNGILNMIVEIPRWTNAKLELKSAEPLAPIVQDTKNGKRRYVHNVYPYKGYIWNYGCFPQTWEDPSQVHMETGALGDGDPLDVCEIGTSIAKVGEIKQVKVLGVLGMIDSGEMDWKVVAIDIHDRLANELNDVDDLYRMLPGLQHATFSWFRTYKIPDGKKENVFAFREEIQSRSYAMEIVEECHKSWKKLVTGRVTHPNHNCLNTTLDSSFSPYRCSVEEANTHIKAYEASMSDSTSYPKESKLTRNQSLAEISKGDGSNSCYPQHNIDENGNVATRQLLTIKRFCTQQQRQFPHGSNDLALLMSELGVAFKCIAAYAKDRPFMKLYDMQRYADFQIYSSLASSGLCCLIYSTFAKDFLPLDKDIAAGNYVVVYTPLCGVMGGSLGTIFSVYYRKSASGKEGDTSDLVQRSGFDQVAAGYCLYSSSIVFTFSIGFGVHIFGLDIVSGHFVVAHPHVHIPTSGPLYSVDTQVIPKAVDGVDTFLANMENDASRQFRFEDCTVANFHKVLCRGGIMMLPGPKKENLANFLGEAAPFAFLARQAGGRASVGRRPVLELSAWSLEMCVPLFIGSKEDVDEVERLVLGHPVVEKTVMGATVIRPFPTTTVCAFIAAPNAVGWSAIPLAWKRFFGVMAILFQLYNGLYLVIYRTMVPPTFYRIPLFFDFSSPYPVSTVKLGRKQIGYASRLDGTLHVCFPESPRNMDIGMMMFTLEIVSRNDTIFYSRFRPTVLRYKDDLETKMETLTYFFLLLMGWKKRQQCQDLALLEYKETSSNGYDGGGGGGFLKRLREDVFLRIWINKGNVEVYHCELWLHTELRGIRYWMKRYKWLFGLVAIGNLWFWLFSSLSLVLFVSLFLWLPH